MHLGAGLLQCAGLEQKVGLPAPFAQGRVARRLNSTAPDPMPRSSTTATRSPTGDEVEPVSWFRLSAAGAVCSRRLEREARGSCELAGPFEFGGSFEFEGLEEARLLLGVTPDGALGAAAASAGLAAGAGVRGGVGTGVVAGREAAAGAGVRGGAASRGRAAASPAAEIGTTAESQPPPTESDGLLAASAGGGGTRGAGASESLRFRENDQPCTEPGGGKIFPAPKLL